MDISRNLNENEWHSVLFGDLSVTEKRLKELGDDYDKCWHEPVLEASPVYGKTLETGSGTGQISAQLAKNNRIPTMLDFSYETLGFNRRLFEYLGLEGEYVIADITRTLPFSDNSFDCVWSEGVLEHFSDQEMISILKESSRVSRGTVVAMVPNAFSVAYRAGKWYQELRGVWQYGKEVPRASLKRQFELAGLRVIKEYSIDPFQAFKFLTFLRKRSLGEFILKLFNRIPKDVLCFLNQGWLLVTIGEKEDHE